MKILPSGTKLNNTLQELPPATPSGGAGGSIATQDEGISVDTAATTLNFVGSGVDATDAGSHVTKVTIPGANQAGGGFNWGKFIAGQHMWPFG